MQRKWKRRWQRTLVKIILPPVAAASILLSVYGVGFANPTGATVTAGSAVIAQTGSKLMITTSDKTAINWQSYNIGKGEAVQYIQPSANSVVLNRVTGNDASKIYGTLSANGKVFLINPHGVLFAPGSQVNVGGLVASSLNLSDQDFINSNYHFSGTGGSVINQGTITVGDTGYVALLGAQAKNEGVIIANQGTVALGGGKVATLDLANDGFLQLVVDQSALNASVANSSVIQAGGGKVYMSACTADALAGTVVNNSGTIQARSISNKNGVIILDGVSSGMVINSGVLDASGTASAQTGGTVKVLGERVDLAAGTRINISGYAGGGTALIGGNYQGGGTEQNATKTTVAAGVSINADSITAGNGGKVVVWANDVTNFTGSITARGGSISGDGGNVEVSGKNTLTYQGHTITSAANGRMGNLLLDPTDFTIGLGASGTNYKNNAELEAELLSNNITMQTSAGIGNGDLTVNAPISWATNSTLTLQAHRNINVNAAIESTGAGNLVINPGASGYLLVGSGGSVHFSGAGKLYFGSQEYTLINDLAGWNSMATGTSGFYALNADITGVTAVKGTTASPFIGTIDGLGHKATVNINSSGYVGLFGRTEVDAVFRNLGVGGSISGIAIRVGGLIGSNYGGNVINCYSTVNLTMTNASDIGGLVGVNAANAGTGGQIINSYSTGTMTSVNNATNAGGLVGTNSSGSIVNSYSTIAVNASGYYSGGLVGENAGTIFNSYSTGDVTGSAYAGGLVGHNKNTIQTSFSTGKVSASTVGGLVGERAGYETIANCFWDKENSNITDAVGETAQALSSPGAAGITTAQMKTASTFAGWDQSVWKFYDGSSVPLLKSLLKPLTITATAADISKIYDGLSTAYNGSFAYSTGTKPAEVVGTLSYAGGGVNAGTYTPTGLFSGQQGGYDITINNVGGTLKVNKATLTYVADAANRFYGDANPIFSGSVSGFVGADNQGNATTGTLAWSTGATQTSNVGSYAITGNGLTLTSNNYEFAQAPSNTAALTLNKATLTYTANADSRLYGDTNPAVSGSISGWKNADNQGNATTGTLTWNTGATPTSNVGSYGINGGGLTATNYDFVQDASNTTALTVNKAALTYTANAASKTYGDANPVISGTISGWKNADNQVNATSGTLNWSTTADATSNAGSYAINGGGLTATNYDFVQGASNTTALTVNKVALTYTAKATSKTYGDANPVISGTISGWKNSDNQGNTTSGTLNWYTTADTTSNVGNYAINGGGLTAANYDFVQAASNATALMVNKAALTVTANAISKVYGASDPSLTYGVSGLVNGEQAGYVLSGSLSRTAGETVAGGLYAINQGTLGANSNYTITFISDNLTITPRPLTVTANNAAKTAGAPNPVFSATYSDLAAGDTPATSTGALIFGTTATTASPAGSYTITSTGTLASSNYTVTYVNGILTVTRIPDPYNGAVVVADWMVSGGGRSRINSYNGFASNLGTMGGNFGGPSGGLNLTIVGSGINQDGYTSMVGTVKSDNAQ